MSDNVNKKILENFSRYIVSKKKELGLTNEGLATECKISSGEISKLITMERKNISPKTFYLISKGVKDSFLNTFNSVYKGYKFSLKNHVPQNRNEFGNIMSKYENQINCIEEIAAKTGISLSRLKNLYYKDSSISIEELILIEKAIDKRPGELFEELYGKP